MAPVKNIFSSSISFSIALQESDYLYPRPLQISKLLCKSHWWLEQTTGKTIMQKVQILMMMDINSEVRNKVSGWCNFIIWRDMENVT